MSKTLRFRYLLFVAAPLALGCSLLTSTVVVPPSAQTIPARSTIPPAAPGESTIPSVAPQGLVYYVSPDGADSNSGATQNQPWRTIQKAADTLVAGETVYIMEGTYHERIRPRNSGTAGEQITFAAHPGDEVIIDGRGVYLDEWGGLFEIYQISQILVSGLQFINSGSAGILVDEASQIVIQNNYTYNTVSSGIGVWDSDHVIIQGNEVVLANNDGEQENITVAGTNVFEVRYNHVHHGGPGSNGGEGIDVKDGSSNGKVYGNHIHDLNRLGIYVDAWDKHTYNIEVFQNVVHDNGDSGFTLASEAGGLLENIALYNNIAYHNKYDGITISGCCSDLASHHPLKDITIINNTFYNNGWDQWGGGIIVENPDVQNVLIRNNIFSQNLFYQVLLEEGAAVVVDYNLIDGFRDHDGEVRGDDYIEAPPQFVNPSGGDFHLSNGSPAIDQGSCAQAPAGDFDGNPRPQDGDQDGEPACDIGAYEVTQLSMRFFLPLVVSAQGTFTVQWN